MSKTRAELKRLLDQIFQGLAPDATQSTQDPEQLAEMLVDTAPSYLSERMRREFREVHDVLELCKEITRRYF